MDVRTLERTPLPDLHAAFLAAFSDYQVPMELELPQFETMLKREGFDPACSAGAFVDGTLVGFVLSGVRDWEGRRTLYDLGTAVLPAHRGQQVTTRLLALVKEHCAALGVSQCLLEVLQENIGARKLYERQGFQIVRALDCFRGDRAALPQTTPTGYTLLRPDALSPEEWETVRRFWDYAPSWQNSVDSVRAVPAAFSYALAVDNGTIVGYGVMSRDNGSVVQLAVAPDCRRKGLGRAILNDLAARTNSDTFRAANVDSRSAAAHAFLAQCGFQPYVSQYEMIQQLS